MSPRELGLCFQNFPPAPFVLCHEEWKPRTQARPPSCSTLRLPSGFTGAERLVQKC